MSSSHWNSYNISVSKHFIVENCMKLRKIFKWYDCSVSRQELVCGHVCAGTCGGCQQGRLHVPCSQSCRKVLVCGHDCQSSCCQCPPCGRKCENRWVLLWVAFFKPHGISAEIILSSNLPNWWALWDHTAVCKWKDLIGRSFFFFVYWVACRMPIWKMSSQAVGREAVHIQQ